MSRQFILLPISAETRESSRDKAERFQHLCSEVQACRLCPRMEFSARILGPSAGALRADVMFIGEAPGRFGADSSGIPFHGDKAGHNFEQLLRYANLHRDSIFVTNAVLCNPRHRDGTNATPDASEMRNCSAFLRRQIELVDPKVVATLGAVALQSLNLVSPHQIILKEGVRTASDWFNRTLVPLYHPGQRAMIHRSFANQRLDYEFLARTVAAIRGDSPTRRRAQSQIRKHLVVAVVEQLLRRSGQLSYFSLHKLFYLVEYRYARAFGKRLTNAYFIRQLDGPYCTDLHISKLRASIENLVVTTSAGRLSVRLAAKLPFAHSEPTLPRVVCDVVEDVVARHHDQSDADLKTAAYLTAPMRRILRLERTYGRNLVNVPIDFLT